MTQSREDSKPGCARLGPSGIMICIPFIIACMVVNVLRMKVRAWVINRYYYQHSIPMKDAAFMSRVEDPALRRAWRSRIEDHDGTAENEGGIRRWLRLAEAVGLDLIMLPRAMACCPLPNLRSMPMCAL